MKKSFKLMLTLLFAGIYLGVFSQSATRQLTGKVLSTTGEPLMGVSIIVKGTETGTITDANGRFSISANVNNNSILVFSYVGFESKSIVVGGNNNFTVTLSEDMKSLDELVVVGYGAVKKRDLTGSIGSVSAEALTARGVNGALGSMQGAVAGVNITQTSSRPGADYAIQIRGLNSFSSNTPPLFVVDGIVTSDINPNCPLGIVSRN